jgi:hypothetical protein
MALWVERPDTLDKILAQRVRDQLLFVIFPQSGFFY